MKFIFCNVEIAILNFGTKVIEIIRSFDLNMIVLVLKNIKLNRFIRYLCNKIDF